MSVYKEVAGVIMAGGESRRFGCDKALYQWKGKPMIQHVFECLSEVVDPVFISVSNTARRYPISVPHIVDRYPDLGPMSGLYTALMQTDSSWMLVVACDMPAITTDLLNALLKARTPSVNAVVASDQKGRLQPLCALYSRSCINPMARFLEANNPALNRLLETVKLKVITFPDAQLMNVNAPEELLS